MGRHEATLAQMRSRVSELIADFGRYAQTFDDARLFTGPSLYFHFRAVQLLREHGSAAKALQDDGFLEALYATLTAWGMHRMGSRGAKLAEFPEFRASLREQCETIERLEHLHVANVKPAHIAELARCLWGIISQLRVGTGRTKIVAGSKALHHLLPDLLPPIDREYTTRFLYNHTTYNQGDERAFLEMYPCFHQIAVSCQEQITARIGAGMNTSFTKVIDNAIVGYVLTHLK